jgi:hypothetical protein
MTKNLKKITAVKLIFGSKIAIYLSLGLHKGLTSYVQEKLSALKREHPALQSMKILYRFLYFWVILPSWIRIQQLKFIWIHADTDPQHCVPVPVSHFSDALYQTL